MSDTAVSLTDLIREYQRLDEILENCKNDGDDDEPLDRLDDVRDAIEDRLEDVDFWICDDKTGRPVWNDAAVEVLLSADEDWDTITSFLSNQFHEAVWEYEEAISTLYVPRDRNIKCKDLAAKLEPHGIKVRREADQKCYLLFHPAERKEGEMLEAVDLFWRGRTGKFDYLKVGSDYNKDKGQETGADHIMKVIRETLGELLHGQEAAASLLSQKNTSPYWMTTSHSQRVMMAGEEDYIKRELKKQKAAA